MLVSKMVIGFNNQAGKTPRWGDLMADLGADLMADLGLT
jgi:hypothetical protein